MPGLRGVQLLSVHRVDGDAVDELYKSDPGQDIRGGDTVEPLPPPSLEGVSVGAGSGTGCKATLLNDTRCITRHTHTVTVGAV